jgi:predicted dehydrogenase
MTLSWGFLGASRIARNVLAPVVALAGHRLAAVAARDPARAAAFAQEFGAASSYGSYADLLRDPAVDVVYISLTNDAHLPWTVAALESGRHVLCEKPLALNAAEVARMQNAERASGKRVMEAFCHLHHPQVTRVRELLAEGAIGRLLGMQASQTASLGDDDFRWQARLGGGALYDVGCYPISLFRHLVGAEPESVSARFALRGEVDASVAGELRFPRGVTAQFFGSLEAARGQHMLLIGTEGRLAIEWPSSTRGREATISYPGAVERFPLFDPFVAMLHHFAAMCAGTEQGIFPLAQSFQQARVLDALFAAGRGGGVVTVAPAT